MNFRGPSTTFRSTCPRCHNGSRHEDCFAVTVIVDERDVQVPARPASVVWCCHRGSCQFTGGVSLHTKLMPGATHQYPQGPLQRIEQQQQQQLQAHLQHLQQQQQVWPAPAQPQAQPWQQGQQQLLQQPWQQPQGPTGFSQPTQQALPRAPTLPQVWADRNSRAGNTVAGDTMQHCVLGATEASSRPHSFVITTFLVGPFRR